MAVMPPAGWRLQTPDASSPSGWRTLESAPFVCPVCKRPMTLGGEEVSDENAAQRPDFKEMCFRAREYLLAAEPMLQELRKLALAERMAADVTGEMVANVMHAFRHLEDCRMRIGKAIQAFDGGASVYPR